MTEIENIENLIMYYGADKTLGNILKSLKNKTPFLCPKCDGTGYWTSEFNNYPVRSS